jgi:hypothetical protein
VADLTDPEALRVVVAAQRALRELNKLELLLIARFGSGRPDPRLQEEAGQAIATAGGHAARLRGIVEQFPGHRVDLAPLVARLDELHEQFDEIERAVGRRN